jgi:hypothetical protein
MDNHCPYQRSLEAVKKSQIQASLASNLTRQRGPQLVGTAAVVVLVLCWQTRHKEISLAPNSAVPVWSQPTIGAVNKH